LFGQLIMMLILFTSVGLILFGVFSESFNFVFKGATAYALEVLGVPLTRSFSIVSLGAALPSSTANPNAFGIRWIQAVFIAFTVVFPLAHLASLLFLWLTPLKRETQRKFFVLTEVLNAWSALEVFIIAIIAAILEIQQFAKFIVGSRCNSIDVYLKEYFSDIMKGDFECFDVVATLSSGCWILFGACILYLFTAIVIMKTCHSALDKVIIDNTQNTQINSDEEENDSNQLGRLSEFFLTVGLRLKFVAIVDGDETGEIPDS